MMAPAQRDARSGIIVAGLCVVRLQLEYGATTFTILYVLTAPARIVEHLSAKASLCCTIASTVPARVSGSRPGWEMSHDGPLFLAFAI